MGAKYKNGKLVGYDASPDDPTPVQLEKAGVDESIRIKQTPDEADPLEVHSNSALFTAEDRTSFPRRGHIPGSIFAPDGKVVTNPGLRKTDFAPGDD